MGADRVQGRIALAVPAVLAVCLFAAAPAARSTIHTVNAGGNLQAALNAAQPGDEIVLQAGATFTGNFKLPVKPSGPPITVRSSAVLPSRRITPADAGLLPTIRSGNGGSAIDALGTSNWRLDGLRFEPNVGGFGNVIQLQDVVSVTLDRILLVVPDGQQQKRGVAGNGRHVTLTRSHIAGVWRSGQDSQAFCAWDGAGPYTVTDNYLEAASENVMFGGANSKSSNRIPSDILVENNHFSKPLNWKGQPHAVKNLFELKSAKRVIVRNNLFEHNWSDAQNGYAILFTVRNDEGGSPWSAVEGVVFERNIVRDTERGINVLGYDSYQPSGRTTQITIRHNLVETSSDFLQVGAEVGHLALDHNTVVNGGSFAKLYPGDVWAAGNAKRPAQYAAESLTITNTLAYHGPYGVIGESAAPGTPSLTKLTRSFAWTHNVLAGGGSYTYPQVTWRPSVSEHAAQFAADYSLLQSSTYRNAGNDGEDLGARLDAKLTLTAPRNVRFVR